MSTPLIIAIGTALLIYVIVKRFAGEPLNARDTAVPPIVLLAIGIHGLVQQQPTGADLAWIVAGSLIGFGFGALRGTTIRLLTRDGVLWQRYTVWTLAVWMVSLAVNAGVSILGAHFGAHEDVRPMQLAIGVSLLGEALTLGLRGLATGYPFAPERIVRTGSPLEPIPAARQRLRGSVDQRRVRSALDEWNRTGNARSALEGWQRPDPERPSTRPPTGWPGA
ncbi:hypothetical protein [Nocardia sp. IFM 10818]